ncbi:MAG TPA: DUF5722 domain-containing protein [Verrucomicrobiae bacterium]|nr:DUF5722 domain-containing protein [Verrucomicrobiae bacterium]
MTRHPICQRSLALLVLLAGSLPCESTAETPLALDPATRNQLEIRPEPEGVFALATQGEDPFVLLRAIDPQALTAADHVLAFEYFCPDGINDLEIFFGPPIVAGQSFSAGEMRRAESWQPFSVDLREASGGRWSAKFNRLRLDFGRRAGIELRVRNLRLRPPNEAERQSAAERETIRQRKAAAAETVLQYLDTPMPARITVVSVRHDEIEIQGVGSGQAGELKLIEAQPWQELWKGDISVAQAEATGVSPFRADATGRFTATLPRFDGARDRLTSRWAVASLTPDHEPRLLSHFVYATDLREACPHPDLDEKTTEGIKGMAGVWPNDILDELVELGVKHVTDNVWISDLFSLEPRAGWSTYRRNGRTWWVNPARVQAHDRLAGFATRHGMIVSAIILVGFGDSGFAKLLQHPEAERAGQYAMPDLTTREGVEAYEAAIAFLAERYAQPGDPHGRITNWILHNEVDYGWEWTNMGAQPLAVYLDSYVRSMRIVHTLARQFNPHARVFISLTHNWNVPDDPAWKTYGPRRMLELLAKFSRVEGDFEWGVAYHPYPQSLFKADAWNDTLPTDDFDTPLITPKNIAVLDRWMHRPEMLFQGRVRGVILSEQGYHTPDYSEASQRLQAAAFVYTWHKLRGLKSIEAFHNHRWVDHPQEGGLKLGVRTLPTDGKPYGDRKFAWGVYQALDTPEEAAKTEFAKEIIGVKEWEDIQPQPEW